LNAYPANRILGYPTDARLLIVNADDFGMCHAINEAIIRCLQSGIVRSTTLMVPCPWALHAIHYLAEHPEVPFGIHLTAISDPADYRWGPVLPPQKVPSLVGPSGYFFNFEGMAQLFSQINLQHLEAEFKAQIEAVIDAGLKPTHLDWHALRLQNQPGIFDLMIRLAKEYGLALRMAGRERIEELQSQGFPTIDRDFLDSYLIQPQEKLTQYAQLLHELPTGLSEWAVHPGLDTPELLALEPTGHHERQIDFDFWTSTVAKQIIEEENITLIDYRPLQAFWRDGQLINGEAGIKIDG